MAEPGRPDLAVHLVDSRHEPTEMDGELRDWLRQLGVRREIVLTKVDKLSRNEKDRALREAARWLDLPDGGSPIAVSAATGDGMPALWRVIDEVCENDTHRAAQADRL